MPADSPAQGLRAFALSTALHAALFALPVYALSAPPPASPPPVLEFVMDESPSPPAPEPAQAAAETARACPIPAPAAPATVAAVPSSWDAPAAVAPTPVTSSSVPPNARIEEASPSEQPLPQTAVLPAVKEEVERGEPAFELPPAAPAEVPIAAAAEPAGSGMPAAVSRLDGTVPSGSALAGLKSDRSIAPESPGGPGLPSSRAGARTEAETVFGQAHAPAFRSRVAPAYPDRERRAGVEGRVSLRLWIDEDGTLRDVEVLASDAVSFTAAALKALRASTYAPARDAEGRPLSSRARLTLRFRLESAR